MVIWLTGNSGAGKTTLAKRFAKENGWINLDGDEMRASISLGAGFSKEQRELHNLRVARLAKILHKQGFDVIVSVIAPFQVTRDQIDAIMDDGFSWVYIKRLQPTRKDYPYQPPKGVVEINTGVCTKKESYEQLRRAIYE